MFDARARIERAEGPQYGVVRDFARQPDIVGIDPARFAAHQDFAPVRRRPQTWVMFAAPKRGEQEIDAFPFAAELERASAAERAKERSANRRSDGCHRRSPIAATTRPRWRQSACAGCARRAWAVRWCRTSAGSIRFRGSRRAARPAARAAGGRARAIRRGIGDRASSSPSWTSASASASRTTDSRVRESSSRRTRTILRPTVKIDQRRGRLGHVAHEENRQRPSRRARCEPRLEARAKSFERENMISRNDDPAATGADLDETRKAWRFRQRLRHRAQ